MPILSSCHLSVPSRDTVKSKYVKTITARYRHLLSNDDPEAGGYELGDTQRSLPFGVFCLLPLSPSVCAAACSGMQAQPRARMRSCRKAGVPSCLPGLWAIRMQLSLEGGGQRVTPCCCIAGGLRTNDSSQPHSLFVLL